MIGREHFFINVRVDDNKEDLLEYFIKDYYTGTPFIPRDYIFYGWFHPDTTVKEYLNLPEETRCFSQEEIDKIVSVIYDLRDQYYRASSLKERKDFRKKIAEKLKQEYPIR